MLNRRRIPLAIACVSVLVLASSAAAAPNTFSVTLTPTHVKPATDAAYTLTLTNALTSAQADRAKIAIPAGFTEVHDVTANATAAGSCAASAWGADGTLIADGKINIKRPSGGGNRNLCPGATLTVVFSATSPAAPGSYTWTPELLLEAEADEEDEEDPFTFTGDPTVQVDGAAPETAITSAPPTLTRETSASFTFGSSEAGTAFECSLDGALFSACNTAAAYSNLADGPHTFSVRAVDAAGNTGEASHTWTIDATAPETTLGSRPRSGTTTVSATFTFSASESAAFQCKLDAGAFAPCTSPKAHAGLRRTTHTFEVRAIDTAGNIDPSPAVHRWTIAAAPRRARATSALLGPRAGARVTSPPLLRWRRVARASYYNVQLYRGSVKVLSAWPTRPRLQLRARWTYRGQGRRLAAGTYRWYVWPGYGSSSARRYGRLLGESRFIVATRR